MQLRGGRGYEKARSLKARGETPYPVERIMRDTRINTILEGTSEIMRLFLAREAIEPHLKKAGPLLKKGLTIGQKASMGMKLLGFYLPWYLKQSFGFSSSFKEQEPLSKEFIFIETYAHRLAKTLFNAMAKYQAHLEKKQILLGHLMEVGTDLFIMTATCSYALSKKDPQSLELARYFCTLAQERIEGHFHAIKHSYSKKTDQLAEEVIEGKMLSLEEGIVS